MNNSVVKQKMDRRYSVRGRVRVLLMYLFVCMSSGLLFSSHSNAQSLDADDEEALFELYGDEDMVSVATGARQSIAKAPAVATVITAKDIHAMGATDLDEVLETVPGLHVARNNFGYAPIYTMRGIYSNYSPQVLVLINGIPITNLYSGDRNLIWGGMPVKAIARIEVIRGPGSAVYGAEAFAGVISIITKSSDDIEQTTAGVRAGSFNTRDGWVLASDSWGDTDVALTLEYHKTDGQDEKIDADAQTGLDAASGTNASLAPGSVNLSRENLDVRFDATYQNLRFRAGLQRRRDFGNGAGVAEALDPHNRYASDRRNFDLTYHNAIFAQDWDLTVQLSYLDTSQEVEEDLIIFPPGVNLGVVYPNGFIGNPEIYERHSRFNVSTFFTGIDRHQLRFGAGYYLGEIYKVKERKNFGIDPSTGAPIAPDSPLVDVSDSFAVFMDERDRQNRYAFVQDQWGFIEDWEFTLGLRYDDFSDFGDTFNPRAALVWSTRHDLTMKLLYGRAFRSPSYAELLIRNNPAVIGNPDLDPEKIDSVELAFDYRPVETLRLGLNIFSYWWKDIIQYVPNSDPTTGSTAQNSGKQVGRGIEAELNWQITGELDITGNFAYQDSEERPENGNVKSDAANSPQKQLYLAAKWRFIEFWSVQTQVNYVLDRARAEGDSRSSVNDYAVTDLTIRRISSNGNWGSAVSIRNLFNSDAREPSSSTGLIPDDLPLSGRSIYAELDLRF